MGARVVALAPTFAALLVGVAVFGASSGLYDPADRALLSDLFEEKRARMAYGDNLDRLAELKTEYDPENLLHSNLNVVPTRGRPDVASRHADGRTGRRSRHAPSAVPDAATPDTPASRSARATSAR